jgi:hypothetical protein
MAMAEDLANDILALRAALGGREIRFVLDAEQFDVVVKSCAGLIAASEQDPRVAVGLGCSFEKHRAS